MKKWWQSKAQPWLEKNWQWVLLPVGLLLAVAKAFGGRKTTVVGSELTGAAKTEHEADEKATKAVEEAKTERAEAITEAQADRDKHVRILTEEQAAEAKKLSSNPPALNDYLKKVGKDVRK